MGWGPSPFGWLPIGLNDEQGFRLDIVSLLAVIGESSMSEQSQALTASKLCMLPRLLPAPQVLLKATRPIRLPETKAHVVGVESGTLLHTLNYFPNILHPLDKLEPLGFRVFHIELIEDEKKREEEDVPRLNDGAFDANGMGSGISTLREVEEGRSTGGRPPIRGINRSSTIQHAKEMPPALVPVKSMSPLTLIDMSSCLVTFFILGIAIWNRDGIAVLALVTLSLVSSICGAASFWSPSLMRRASQSKAPRGDVMVRSREGGFIYVKCSEEVARELYFGTEKCVYQVADEKWYRLMVGLATFFLMSGVVLLGNCKFYQQLAISLAYVILNGVYWINSLTPKQKIWDMSRYNCQERTNGDFAWCQNAHELTDEEAPSYTRTLWYAIRASRSIKWCRLSNATPDTPSWNKWLEQAWDNLDEPHWDSIACKNKLTLEQCNGDEGEKCPAVSSISQGEVLSP